MTALRNKDNIFQDVKTLLRSQHMRAYDSWIMGCVEHFIQDGCTLAQIKENARQQWLLNNLKDICPGSLPANFSNLDKANLDGSVVLQINSVLDISVPAYQQYLKLKKTDTENIKATMNPEEKISSKRMLKFELTDGKQDIAGMEYETLTKIKTEEILPGSKILIKGPVRCRQGILLLTDTALEFLGGECMDMLEQYSLAAQLNRKLNFTRTNQAVHVTNGVIPDESSSAAQNISRQNDVTDRPLPSRQTETHSNPGTSNSSRPTTSHINSHGPSKRPLETEAGTEKKMKHAEDIIDDDDLDMLQTFFELEEVAHTWSTQSSSAPVVTSPEPFVYIKQINELSESQKSMKVFTVKAQIQNVLTKLTMTANRQWNLKCTIIDGTGCMDVEFSSDILSKFLGYTPENISELKKKVATNPGIKSEINAAYAKTAETLRTLYCIMELTMYTLPKITKLIDFEDYHADMLKKRLDSKEVKLKSLFF